MKTCENCGRDHGLEILDHIEDYAIIERAMQVVEEEHPKSPPLSASAMFLLNNISEMIFERAVEYSRVNNTSPTQEVTGAITSALAKALCIGVATSHHFQDALPIPTVHVTEEMVEEKRAFIQDLIHQVEEENKSGLPPEVLEFLKQNGIDPSQVHVMKMDASAFEQSEKEDDDGHGMYL